MPSKNTEIDTAPLTGKLIYIIGPRQLQNELMASFVERETNAKCIVNKDITHIPGIDDKEIDQDNSAGSKQSQVSSR